MKRHTHLRQRSAARRLALRGLRRLRDATPSPEARAVYREWIRQQKAAPTGAVVLRDEAATQMTSAPGFQAVWHHIWRSGRKWGISGTVLQEPRPMVEIALAGTQRRR